MHWCGRYDVVLKFLIENVRELAFLDELVADDLNIGRGVLDVFAR